MGTRPGDYSQDGEQDHILKYFEKTIGGRFLDIGAHDGKSNSNTRALAEQRGWKGTLVEPSPGPFSCLQKLYGAMGSGYTLICAAVHCDDEGKVVTPLTFYDAVGDQVSTSNYRHFAQWSKDVPGYQRIYVGTITPEFLARGLEGLQLMSIDAEGESLEILQWMLFYWSLKSRPEMIVVEKDGPPGRMVANLIDAGYDILTETRENYIAIKRKG